MFSHKIDNNKKLQMAFVCLGGHCPTMCTLWFLLGLCLGAQLVVVCWAYQLEKEIKLLDKFELDEIQMMDARFVEKFNEEADRNGNA